MYHSRSGCVPFGGTLVGVRFPCTTTLLLHYVPNIESILTSLSTRHGKIGDRRSKTTSVNYQGNMAYPWTRLFVITMSRRPHLLEPPSWRNMPVNVYSKVPAIRWTIVRSTLLSTTSSANILRLYK